MKKHQEKTARSDVTSSVAYVDLRRDGTIKSPIKTNSDIYIVG